MGNISYQAISETERAINQRVTIGESRADSGLRNKWPCGGD